MPHVYATSDDVIGILSTVPLNGLDDQRGDFLVVALARREVCHRPLPDLQFGIQDSSV